MQDTDIKIKPRPSKLFLYERFYRDLEIFRKNNQNFAITEFACGASKILKSINPNFYQGIDLKEELISKSKETYENDNYKFFVGSMIDFNTKIKTNLGICIQTFGINLSFDEEILLKCLNNLNNHISPNGTIIFNLSLELYLKHKEKIDGFIEKNFSNSEIIYYGFFNERYFYRLTRILIFLEKLLFFKSRFKKFVYIKCNHKKSDI